MRPERNLHSQTGLIPLLRFAVLAGLALLISQSHGVLAGPGDASRASPTLFANLDSVGKIDDVGRGSLFFRPADGGDLRLAPLVSTEVTTDVGSLIARTKISQTFINPTEEWLEGIYVFPLSETASVDHLAMQVGDRTIEGVIKSREEARQAYEQARDEGKRAALLESERPNVFTSSVANIAPGALITVTFEYQQKLRYDQGEFRLRFPTVVAHPGLTRAAMTVHRPVRSRVKREAPRNRKMRVRAFRW